ncbi:hypothetical protein OC834_002631 [Tilletia horrida]|nr:hypothetical protein OC834_002631 [Tilletia horrida]
MSQQQRPIRVKQEPRDEHSEETAALRKLSSQDPPPPGYVLRYSEQQRLCLWHNPSTAHWQHTPSTIAYFQQQQKQHDLPAHDAHHNNSSSAATVESHTRSRSSTAFDMASPASSSSSPLTAPAAATAAVSAPHAGPDGDELTRRAIARLRSIQPETLAALGSDFAVTNSSSNINGGAPAHAREGTGNSSRGGGGSGSGGSDSNDPMSAPPLRIMGVSAPVPSSTTDEPGFPSFAPFFHPVTRGTLQGIFGEWQPAASDSPARPTSLLDRLKQTASTTPLSDRLTAQSSQQTPAKQQNQKMANGAEEGAASHGPAAESSSDNGHFANAAQNLSLLARLQGGSNASNDAGPPRAVELHRVVSIRGVATTDTPDHTPPASSAPAPPRQSAGVEHADNAIPPGSVDGAPINAESTDQTRRPDSHNHRRVVSVDNQHRDRPPAPRSSSPASSRSQRPQGQDPNDRSVGFHDAPRPAEDPRRREREDDRRPSHPPYPSPSTSNTSRFGAAPPSSSASSQHPSRRSPERERNRGREHSHSPRHERAPDRLSTSTRYADDPRWSGLHISSAPGETPRRQPERDYERTSSYRHSGPPGGHDYNYDYDYDRERDRVPSSQSRPSLSPRASRTNLYQNEYDRRRGPPPPPMMMSPDNDRYPHHRRSSTDWELDRFERERDWERGRERDRDRDWERRRDDEVARRQWFADEDERRRRAAYAEQQTQQQQERKPKQVADEETRKTADETERSRKNLEEQRQKVLEARRLREQKEDEVRRAEEARVRLEQEREAAAAAAKAKAEAEAEAETARVRAEDEQRARAAAQQEEEEQAQRLAAQAEADARARAQASAEAEAEQIRAKLKAKAAATAALQQRLQKEKEVEAARTRSLQERLQLGDAPQQQQQQASGRRTRNGDTGELAASSSSSPSLPLEARFGVARRSGSPERNHSIAGAAAANGGQGVPRTSGNAKDPSASTNAMATANGSNKRPRDAVEEETPGPSNKARRTQDGGVQDALRPETGLSLAERLALPVSQHNDNRRKEASPAAPAAEDGMPLGISIAGAGRQRRSGAAGALPDALKAAGGSGGGSAGPSSARASPGFGLPSPSVGDASSSASAAASLIDRPVPAPHQHQQAPASLSIANVASFSAHPAGGFFSHEGSGADMGATGLSISTPGQLSDQEKRAMALRMRELEYKMMQTEYEMLKIRMGGDFPGQSSGGGGGALSEQLSSSSMIAVAPLSFMGGHMVQGPGLSLMGGSDMLASATAAGGSGNNAPPGSQYPSLLATGIAGRATGMAAPAGAVEYDGPAPIVEIAGRARQVMPAPSVEAEDDDAAPDRLSTATDDEADAPTSPAAVPEESLPVEAKGRASASAAKKGKDAASGQHHQQQQQKQQRSQGSKLPVSTSLPPRPPPPTANASADSAEENTTILPSTLSIAARLQSPPPPLASERQQRNGSRDAARAVGGGRNAGGDRAAAHEKGGGERSAQAQSQSHRGGGGNGHGNRAKGGGGGSSYVPSRDPRSRANQDGPRHGGGGGQQGRGRR